MNKGYFYGIGGKILQGYVLIVAIFLLISGIIFYQSLQSKSEDVLITKKYFPLYTHLIQYKYALENSERLIHNWVNQPNRLDKEKLTLLLESEFPRLKNDIEDIALIGETTKEEKNVIIMVEKIDVLIIHFKKIMTLLKDDEAYVNDQILDDANIIVKENIAPQIQYLTEKFTDAIAIQQQILDVAMEQKKDRFATQTIILVLSIIVFIALTIYSTMFSTKTIVNPINSLKSTILSMSLGEIKEIKLNETPDEVGEMVAATKTMIKAMKSNTTFAIEIGKGNYDSEYAPLGESDELGNSLKNMRENLKLNTKKDIERNWITTGMAQISEILRNSQQDSSTLFRDVIKFIVRYLNTNQGGLFAINDAKKEDKFIEMMACYAYDKEKKHISKRIELNDSIIGESIRDLDTIMLTEIPDQYTNITSGLGHRTPNCILIVPLKINDEAYGAIELASFGEIEPYKIDFVEKIAESIASTMSVVKKNNETQNLLHELQSQEEQMKSQEEEMRQNLEELYTTQEQTRMQEQDMLGRLQEMTLKYEDLQEQELKYLAEINQLKKLNKI